MPEQDSESDTSTEDEEESNTTQTLQVLNVLNETYNDQDESSEENSENEIQPYTENGEQDKIQENKLLTTNFEVKVENQKLKAHNLFNRSTNIQIKG